MSRSSTPAAFPTLLDYIEAPELLEPRLRRSAPLVDIRAVHSRHSCEVQPVPLGAPSESLVTTSLTPSCRSQSRAENAETAGTSISSTDYGSDNKASEKGERQIGNFDRLASIKREGAEGNLAEIMIAELAAEIEALEAGTLGWGVQEVEHIETARMVEDTPELTVAEAKVRLRNFESSPEYDIYARDREFHDRLSRQHPQLPLTRAEGRLKAFEETVAWNRYMEDMCKVLFEGGGGALDDVEEPQTGRPSKLCGDGTRLANGAEGACNIEDVKKSGHKKRVYGAWSKQWGQLGTKPRPGSGTLASGAW